jgi:hypothetical protein
LPKDKYQRYLVERNPKVELAASFVSQISWETDTGTGTDTGTDARRSGLRIRKVQAGTNMPLAGAVFEIRDPDGRLIGSSATGDSGVIDMPLRATGNYTVTETAPPRHHLLPQARTQSVAQASGLHLGDTITGHYNSFFYWRQQQYLQ